MIGKEPIEVKLSRGGGSTFENWELEKKRMLRAIGRIKCKIPHKVVYRFEWVQHMLAIEKLIQRK